MTVATAAPERFDIGRVLAGGFEIVRRRPLTMILLTALFGYLPTAAALWLSTHVLPAPTVVTAADPLAAMRRLALVELIAIFAGGFAWMLQGSVAAAALSDYGERPLSAGAALARVGPRLPMIYVMGVLATLGVLFGTVLLIVPGILLSLAWSQGGIVAAVENTGFRAFGRSAELTRNNRISLFVILLIYGVASFVLSFVARVVAGAALTNAADQPLWLTLGLQPLATSLVQIFLNATMVAAYSELRGVKEGLTATSLAALFD